VKKVVEKSRQKSIKKRDIQIIHNMALRLNQKIIASVCSFYDMENCRECCPFGQHGCAQLDADTIINACEGINENWKG